MFYEFLQYMIISYSLYSRLWMGATTWEGSFFPLASFYFIRFICSSYSTSWTLMIKILILYFLSAVFHAVISASYHIELGEAGVLLPQQLKTMHKEIMDTNCNISNAKLERYFLSLE